MEDTQSIGLSTQVIMPRHSILLRCFLTFGNKAMGHFLGHVSQDGCCDVCAGESANAHKSIWELLDQVMSGPDGLGCSRGCSRLGCGHCCGNRCRICARLPEHDGTIHLHDCQFFHLRVDPGWQDQGCLQHTNMSLACGVKHQGGLAAK